MYGYNLLHQSDELKTFFMHQLDYRECITRFCSPHPITKATSKRTEKKHENVYG